MAYLVIMFVLISTRYACWYSILRSLMHILLQGIIIPKHCILIN